MSTHEHSSAKELVSFDQVGAYLEDYNNVAWPAVESLFLEAASENPINKVIDGVLYVWDGSTRQLATAEEKQALVAIETEARQQLMRNVRVNDKAALDAFYDAYHAESTKRLQRESGLRIGEEPISILHFEDRNPARYIEAFKHLAELTGESFRISICLNDSVEAEVGPETDVASIIKQAEELIEKFTVKFPELESKII
jgi:hypothetical protein